MIDPTSPLYNTIIFYILIISIILITKPSFLYCNKTNKFKPFGCNDNETLLSFPIVSIGTGIILYLIFTIIEILYYYLEGISSDK